MIDSLPQPRTTDPAAVPSLRWGVIGTGWIADQFVTTVTRNTSQRVVAVGSRSLERVSSTTCPTSMSSMSRQATWITPPTHVWLWRQAVTCSSRNL